ncbi:hypothetical protein [Aliiglaciecola sp. LCG003]|uniref:hypothetical protein n=1 Tax=Aliiglaciecola sp. LCG003 TaxID=3053655 RepID=UPI00257465D8|nr:hypothetical protein [Aliiglaciecola sp. LCG003]WJG07758.1 hypothetical protein QR722_10305 [Aliiglaciecola sp. LCG003]
MSKDYRREKEDLDNLDWLSSGSANSRKDKQYNDVAKRKRDSKRISRSRERHPEFH